ncbi:hypothetical protein PMG11_09011 [Penicillium brasilianum]|uniref:Lytic polysaccharide monooxygenase n=1 Tax=Penicillium brasilianum TaxID=104259 RepID=A0A0F7TUS3_PENBI|nr:hypothetical protein PMG11_09011 [Penicillium brasilianum]
MMLAKSFLIAALGASVANAHMIMTQPVPYGKDSLTNSPLDAQGGDFPCKLRTGTYDISQENVMAIGDVQQLRFQGGATHGGGSCQISLTEDRAPSKSSTWKVIKSIEGGCPANADGNLGSDASAADPYHFNFTIPDGIATGKYTLAWTWFNRIGNREMYMNCAPVTVTTGTSSKRSAEAPVIEQRSSSFPPMFVANINGCTTKEGVDIRFPQPGNVVEYDGNPTNLAPASDAACSGTPTFGGSGDTGSGTSSSGSDSGSSGSGSGSVASSTSAVSPPIETSSQAGVPAPTSTSTPAETTAPSVPQPVGSSTTSASPSESSSSDSSSSGSLTGSCSPEGSWNCIAGSSFQRCANGQWTPSQQMAAGTQCTAGKSSDLSISAIKAARAVSGLRFRKRFIGASHHV